MARRLCISTEPFPFQIRYVGALSTVGDWVCKPVWDRPQYRPAGGQAGLRAGPYRRDEPPLGGRRCGRDARPPKRGHPRRGRMASLEGDRDSGQPDLGASAGLQPGTRPDGAGLPVPQGRLPGQPRLPDRRGCLRQPRRALEPVRFAARPNRPPPPTGLTARTWPGSPHPTGLPTPSHRAHPEPATARAATARTGQDLPDGITSGANTPTAAAGSTSCPRCPATRQPGTPSSRDPPARPPAPGRAPRNWNTPTDE